MTTAHTSYLICSTPRTGSSLLCDALAATGVAGPARGVLPVPRPHGRSRAVRRSTSRAPATPRSSTSSARAARSRTSRRATTPAGSSATRSTWTWAVDAGTTPNGVFGAKVMWGYFNGFVTGLRWALPGGRQRLAGARARAVGLPQPALHHGHPARQGAPGRLAVAGAADVELVERAARARRRATTCAYSHAAIDHLIRDIEDHECGWRAYFRECGVEPFTVVYEDFVAALRGHHPRDPAPRRRVAEAERSTIAPPTRRRQADDLSQGWAERYRSEAGRLSHA